MANSNKKLSFNTIIFGIGSSGYKILNEIYRLQLFEDNLPNLIYLDKPAQSFTKQFKKPVENKQINHKDAISINRGIKKDCIKRKKIKFIKNNQLK